MSYLLKLLFLVILFPSKFGLSCPDDTKASNEEALVRFKSVFPFLANPEQTIWQVQNEVGDYIGQLNCSLVARRHGWGEMQWANGTLYGPGNIFIYSNEDRYYGQWTNDKQEGIGTFESQTGIYIGTWSEGLQNGNGTAIYNNGNRYDGQFKDGFKHGNGKFTVTTNGDIYTGEFQQGERHGQGIEKYGSTGETYVGSFITDLRWGLGIAYYKDGSPKYIGSWENGTPQGANGTLFLPNGNKFVGSFVLGRPRGQGTLFGPDGEIVRQGSWGQGADEAPDYADDTGFANNFGLPKMSGLGLNLANNKYTNLLKSIAKYVGISWPFS